MPCAGVLLHQLWSNNSYRASHGPQVVANPNLPCRLPACCYCCCSFRWLTQARSAVTRQASSQQAYAGERSLPHHEASTVLQRCVSTQANSRLGGQTGLRCLSPHARPYPTIRVSDSAVCHCSHCLHSIPAGDCWTVFCCDGVLTVPSCIMHHAPSASSVELWHSPFQADQGEPAGDRVSTSFLGGHAVQCLNLMLNNVD